MEAMENSVTEVKQQRDINIVTAEIKDICAQAQRMLLIYAVEIGRRLVEAKEILPHGEWGEWLKNEVEFSQSTANKHMKIFEAYGSRQISLFGAELNSETFTNLSYSQALKLLAVPEEEREDFVKDNDIENKSVREIDKLIKERDEALKKARAAEEGLKTAVEDAVGEKETLIEEYKRKLDTATSIAAEKGRCAEGLKRSIDDLQAKLDKAKEAKKKAEAKMKEYKQAAENPEIPQEQLDKIKAEAEAEAKTAAENKAKQQIEAELKSAKEKQAELEAEIEKSRRAAEDAEAQIKELKKQMAMAAPIVTEFKTVFGQVRDNVTQLMDMLDKPEAAGSRDNLKAALAALLHQSLELLESEEAAE
ncbi:MAG: DUF3102 domain-containing protein [Candidatus Ornithomonoglobus sp.]